MSTLKKYHNGQWIPVASNMATGIITSQMKENGEGYKNVDEALQDISKLKKNVTWLAMHGGGGSGSGYGDTSSSFQLHVLNPSDINGISLLNKDTKETVYWNSNIRFLKIRITSKDPNRIYTVRYSLSNSRWSVTLNKQLRTLGDNTINLDVGTTSQYNLLPYISGKKELSIRVTNDLDDYQDFSFYIINPSVELSSEGNSISFYYYPLENIFDNIIKYFNMETTITGTYTLYCSWGTPLINNQGIISSLNGVTSKEILLSTTNNYKVPFVLYSEKDEDDNPIYLDFSNCKIGDNFIDNDYISNLSPGTYSVYFIAINKESNSIFSNQLQIDLLILRSNEVSISTAISDNQVYVKNIKNNISFTAYKGQNFKSRFNYTIILSNQSGETFVVAQDTNKTYGGTIQNNIYFNDSSIIGNSEYTLKIQIEDIDTGNIKEFSYDVFLNEQRDTLLHDLSNIITTDTNSDQNKLIFDFIMERENYHENSSRTGTQTYQNNTFISPGTGIDASFPIKSTLSYYNKGASSGKEGRYFKFRHKAYGVIDTIQKKIGNNWQTLNWFSSLTSGGNMIFPGIFQNRQFTISLSYFVDYEESGIIYFAGSKTSTGVNLNGNNTIIIKPTSYHIKFGNTELDGYISNNSFNQFDIVCSTSDNNYITLYHNGKYLQSKEISNADINTIDIQCMYLGGIIYDNKLTESVNFDLYSIRFMAKSLNLGQIVYSYINNFIRFDSKNTYDNSYDSNKLEMLKSNNGIGEYNENTGYEDCSIYNFIDGDYYKYNGQMSWGIKFNQGTLEIGDSPLRNLPLPLVVIDVSGSRYWTYSNISSVPCPETVTTIDNDHEKYVSAKFYYYSPENSNIVTGHNIKVSIQGTSSTGYNSKNYDIFFSNIEDGGFGSSQLEEEYLFTPKNDWLPDYAFTLKADVVDSGHINNAVIGKFINDCYRETVSDHIKEGYSSLLMNKDVYGAQTGNQMLINTKINEHQYPYGSCIKPTIEGFPVMLVMIFKGNNGPDIEFLGIYSFNLGRKSYCNLGYEVLNYYIKKGENDIIDFGSGRNFDAPSLYKRTSNDQRQSVALCYEAQVDYNNTQENYTLQEIQQIPSTEINNTYFASFKDNNGKFRTFLLNDIKNIKNNPSGTDYVQLIDDSYITNYLGENITFNNLSFHRILLDGYFWQQDTSYIDYLWKQVYKPSATLVTTDEYPQMEQSFYDFCRHVVSRTFYSKNGLQLSDDYSYPEYILDSNKISQPTSGSNTPEFEQTGGTLNTGFSIKNISFYYVIAQLFGLVNSLGKNMQAKAWFKNQNGNMSTISQDGWTISFYDMDTALGLDNFGNENIQPYVFDSNFYNISNTIHTCWLHKDQPRNKEEGSFDVYTNRMFGLPDLSNDGNSSSAQRYGYDVRNIPGYKSIYAYTWNILRTYVIHDVERFFDNYFKSQLEEVGELLLNYDFMVKYINTDQRSYLHGDRLDFIKNWITERISFLDSVFGYLDNNRIPNYLQIKDNGNTTNYCEVPYLNTINIKSSPSGTNICMLDIISNKTLIYNYGTTQWFIEKDKVTRIKDYLNTNNYSINNSNCIKEINEVQDGGLLSELQSSVCINGIYDQNRNQITYPGAGDIFNNQYGTLSSLEKYTALNGDILKVLKPWDISNVYNRTIKYSQLKSITINTNTNIYGETNELKIQYDFPFSSIPDRYREIFNNLTDINIVGSSVTSVKLPENLSLYSFDFYNSRLSSLNLKHQPLLNQIVFRGCSNLGSILIESCEGLTSLGQPLPSNSQITIGGLGLNSDNNTLYQVNISDCKNLTTITLNGIGLNRNSDLDIIIENMPELVTINIVNIQRNEDFNNGTLKISGCPKLKNINLSNNYGINSIQYNGSCNQLDTLNLSNTNISKFYSGTSENSQDYTFDFSQFESINTLNCKYNRYVKYIKFSNTENDPFEIKTSSAFLGCINLERVYGNIILNASSIFQYCVKFSILGTETKKYLEQDMIQSGTSYEDFIYKHFIDVNDNILNDEDKILDQYHRPKFQPGDNVTNMKLTGDISSCFRHTKCTVLDVYYILLNISENVTTLSSLFEYESTSTSEENYQVNNRLFDRQSPDENLFINCANVTNLSTIFYGKGGTSSIFINKNLFNNTPNLTSISSSFYTYKLIIPEDIYLPNKITSINRFNVIKIVSSSDHSVSTGNMSFIHGLNKLENYFKAFYNLDLLDYSTLKFPNVVKNIYSSFNATNVLNNNNNLNFSSLFDNPGNIIDICSSFCVLGGNSIDIKFDTDFFDAFTKLTRIGDIRSSYKERYDNLAIPLTSQEDSLFTFQGMNKKIESLPIFKNVNQNPPRLRLFTGVFRDAETNDQNEILLPGDMFSNCQNLMYIDYCFYNFKTNYSIDFLSNYLSENQLSQYDDTEENYNNLCPFRNCPNLKSVSYLFGCDIPTSQINLGGTTGNVTIPAFNTSRTIFNKLNSMIPYKLFYHGMTSNTSTIEGYYEDDCSIIVQVQDLDENDPITNGKKSISTPYIYYVRGYDLIDSNTIKVYPNTVIYDQDSEREVYPNKEQLISIGFDSPQSVNKITQNYKRNIINIDGCFKGAYNIKPYSNLLNNNFKEYNSSYNPFKYYLNNNRFYLNQNINSQEYTNNHIFDGMDDQNIVVTLDDITNHSNSAQFICCPDLLKYCNNTLSSLNNLFDGCGNPYIGKTQNQLGSFPDVGFKNVRIVPYLLRYTPNIKSVVNMFRSCSGLIGYDLLSYYYIIPKTFFSYAKNITNLRGMFSFCYFNNETLNKNIYLNVFQTYLKNSLNLDLLFYKFNYVGTQENRLVLSNIFNNVKCQHSINRVFASIQDQSEGSAYNQAGYSNIYVQLGHNFTKSGVSYYNSQTTNPTYVYYGLKYVLQPGITVKEGNDNWYQIDNN